MDPDAERAGNGVASSQKGVDIERCRGTVEHVDRVVLDDVPTQQHCDGIGHRSRLVTVMRHKKDGRLYGGAQRHHEVVHLRAQLRVERAKGLIEQQHRGACRKCPCQGDTLFLAARQRRRSAPVQISDSHELEKLCRRRTSLALGHTTDHEWERDVVQD